MKKNFVNNAIIIFTEQSAYTRKHKDVDDFSSNTEISKVKNILKIPTPSARAFTVFTYSPFT